MVVMDGIAGGGRGVWERLGWVGGLRNAWPREEIYRASPGESYGEKAV